MSSKKESTNRRIFWRRAGPAAGLPRTRWGVKCVAAFAFWVALGFNQRVSNVHEYQLLIFLLRALGVGLTCETRTQRGPDFSLLPRF